jgi:VWFA-related protein
MTNQPVSDGSRARAGNADWLLVFAAGLLALAHGALAQSSPSAEATPTFKTGTTNVIVDVVVTGRHRAPVKGLTRDSFSILEDGHVEPVVSFESHPSESIVTAGTSPTLPTGAYTNMQSGSGSDTVDVLLIDALNTPTEAQASSHQKLVAFLATLPANKPVAIFLLDTQLQLLEDFTTDHTALLAAVNQFTSSPRKSALLKTTRQTGEQIKEEDDKVSFFNGFTDPAMHAVGEQLREKLQQFNAEQDSSSDSIRVQYTLAAFDQLGRYLSGMPGRKNVIWLSGSFPLAILPDPHLNNSFAASRDFSAQVDRTASLLANARVALYPIDARGVLTQSLSNPSVSASSTARLSEAESDDFTRHAQEQMSQEKVAEATGGKAIYNTNDLKGALAEVDQDGSYYYTLVYAPSDKPQDGKVRNIEVRVKPGNYHLSYRRTYAPAAVSQQTNSFAMLMRHKTIASTQIPFAFSPLRVATLPATAPLVGNNPNVPRPVVRYSLDYDVDVTPLVLTASSDGVLHGSTTLLTIAYDRDGKALNSISSTLRINVPPADYQRFMKQGIHYHEQLDLPMQSAWLRAGILDPSSGLVGSLEVPISVSQSNPSH